MNLLSYSIIYERRQFLTSGKEIEGTQLVEEVKQSVADRHKVSGITTSVLIELQPNQELPTEEFINKLLLNETRSNSVLQSSN